MNRQDEAICKAVVNLQPSILGAGIIENLALIAMDARPNVPLPKQERMVAQSEILVSIAKTNEDFFGPFRYIVSSFENSDLMFIPIRGPDRVFVIQATRPFDHESVADQVKKVVMT